jgi:glutathione-specific gamma-glutamylcyclotransferase
VLAFVANRKADNFVGVLSDDETATMIATGAGFLGTNLDYLLRTYASLREHGIADRGLERLARLCGCGAAASPKASA